MSGNKYKVNGIPMMEGHSFGWEIDTTTGKSLLKIVVGSIYNMRTCMYDTADHILIITTVANETQVPFYAQGLNDAEKIVDALHKGMKCTVLPLYKKPK